MGVFEEYLFEFPLQKYAYNCIFGWLGSDFEDFASQVLNQTNTSWNGSKIYTEIADSYYCRLNFVIETSDFKQVSQINQRGGNVYSLSAATSDFSLGFTVNGQVSFMSSEPPTVKGGIYLSDDTIVIPPFFLLHYNKDKGLVVPIWFGEIGYPYPCSIHPTYYPVVFDLNRQSVFDIRANHPYGVRGKSAGGSLLYQPLMFFNKYTENDVEYFYPAGQVPDVFFLPAVVDPALLWKEVSIGSATYRIVGLGLTSSYPFNTQMLAIRIA